MTATQRYIEPGWFTRNVVNPLVRRFARWGVSYRGTRELAVVGRTSGQVRTTVVNLLDLEGRQYLVAPRGNTQWVRNVRAAGRAELRLGRRGGGVGAGALPDDQKPPGIKEKLRRWRREGGMVLEGVH